MLLAQSVTYRRGMRLPSFVASLGKASLKLRFEFIIARYAGRPDFKTTPLSVIRGRARREWGEAYISMRTSEQRGHHVNLVGLSRLELPTSPLSGVRSNQLSYRPSFS